MITQVSDWWMGSARCLPGPMFPGPYVPRFMILVPMFPMFPSPYVTQKCFPVQLLPKIILPSPCVRKYPCSPYSPVPMFPSPYVPQSLCSQSICFPVPIDVHQSLCSPVPISPTNSPVPMFPIPIPRKCFPFPIFPKHVPQWLCPQCLCSPNMFPIHYVPPTCSPVHMFPSPIPQKCFLFLLFPQHVPHGLYSLVPMFPSPYVPSPTSFELLNLEWYPFGESWSYIFNKNSEYCVPKDKDWGT